MLYKKFGIKVVLYDLRDYTAGYEKIVSSWCWHSWKVLKRLGVKQTRTKVVHKNVSQGQKVLK